MDIGKNKDREFTFPDFKLGYRIIILKKIGPAIYTHHIVDQVMESPRISM